MSSPVGATPTFYESEGASSCFNGTTYTPSAGVAAVNVLSSTGTWTRTASANAGGGQMCADSTTGDSVTFGITAAAGQYVTSVRIDMVWNTNWGIMNVTVDGNSAGTCDEYHGLAGSASCAQITFYSGASHTVTLSVSGTKNASSSSTQVNVDRLLVDAATDNSPTTTTTTAPTTTTTAGTTTTFPGVTRDQGDSMDQHLVLGFGLLAFCAAALMVGKLGR